MKLSVILSKTTASGASVETFSNIEEMESIQSIRKLIEEDNYQISGIQLFRHVCNKDDALVTLLYTEELFSIEAIQALAAIDIEQVTDELYECNESLRIYSIDEFDELHESMKPSEIAYLLTNTLERYHEFFRYNSNGWIEFLDQKQASKYQTEFNTLLIEQILDPFTKPEEEIQQEMEKRENEN
jgi:hypothetical protein|nr:MAG TPA: hypothetical protein [Caudoviricetes sp.]